MWAEIASASGKALAASWQEIKCMLEYRKERKNPFINSTLHYIQSTTTNS